MNKGLWLLVYLFSTSTIAFGEEQPTPARVGSGDGTLGSRIEFPELKGDTTAVLRCAARVQANGAMKENGCFVDSPADQIFIGEINKAARRAKMTPAARGTSKREIYFQYRVQFDKKGETQTVKILENPGVQENVEAYGQDHVAAQRAIGREPWQKECPSRAEYLVWLKAHVAPDGTASSFSLTHGAGITPTPRCQQSILETAEMS
ncbi:MAG TPA: hypothetical protein VF389_03025, partial [Woeseiaceae bacterium]